MIDHSPCLDQGHNRHPTPGSGQGGSTLQAGQGGEWWLALSLLFGPWLLSLLYWRQLMLRQPLACLTLLPGLTAAALLIHHFGRHLGRNHRPGEGERPFTTLGPANWVTLLRGSACIALAGFLPLSLPASGGLHGPLPWLPGLLYLGMAMADLLDGHLARRSGRVTVLGKSLDLRTDAAGLLIASLLAVALGRLPSPYLLVGMAYYLYRFGIRLRQQCGLPVTPLQPGPYSRIVAGFQMALVGVALLPLLPPLHLAIAAYLFMAPLLLGFLRDWLVVTGRLATGAGQQSVWERWAAVLWTKGLPPLLRLFLLGAVLAWGIGQTPLPPTMPWRLGIVVCTVMAGGGILGRLAGLALALLLAFTPAPAEPEIHSLLLFGAALTLALTGTGPYSLWSPEEAILYRQPTNNANTTTRRGGSWPIDQRTKRG